MIKLKGVSISKYPRKDGRFQGYVLENGIKKYLYGYSYGEVANKVKIYLKGKKEESAIPTTFNKFAMYYFENFRKRKVKELTYKADMNRYKNHIFSKFKELPIKNITPLQCQEVIDAVKKKGLGKTAEEVYSILSVIFKSAIKHNIIKNNPLDIVFHEKHDRNSGCALTKNEELTLKNTLKNEFLTLCMILLYSGLRPNELKTARIENEFIISINSKRKDGKIEYKKIPIIKALKPYLKNGIPDFNYQQLRKAFKKALPNHILYDLRTTFYSRCKEYGVSKYAIDSFVGHSLGALGNAYTDLSYEYLKNEAQKLDFWV